ncbi:hypothetical protein ABZ642_40320 [Streptomyces sp. NPDC007157]|uniref:hypothetical protein n=1 Tax=Streptomyces sp. NPDC007157 TaxID=3154681 RepID=UPI003406CAA9
MIKNVLRSLPALALTVVPLAAPAAAAPAGTQPAGQLRAAAVSAPAARLAPPSAVEVPLFEALSWIEGAEEGSPDGYSREQFRHWNRGENPTDGCDTRKEVILSEALEGPRGRPEVRADRGPVVLRVRPEVGHFGEGTRRRHLLSVPGTGQRG